MRIGIVSPYSFDVPGGVNLHVKDLAEHLIDLGHEVSVLAPADDDTPLPPYVVAAGKAVPVPYNGSVSRLTFGPVTAARVSRWIERGQFDVVHVHEPITTSVSMLALFAVEGPVVATFHTSNMRSRLMISLGSFLQPSLEKLTARIAVSEDARRTVTTHLGGDAVIIPNGVFVDRFAGAQPRPEWQGTADRPTICFLGRMQEARKGLPVLLRAVPAMLKAKPGLRVLIAGPGDERQVLSGQPPEVVAACEMLGAISDEDKARLFASADIYIAPNTGGESFGIILIEAMSAGAPVLASDLGAFVRVLDGGHVGQTFRNEDPADLATEVVRLLDDPERRTTLARLGGQRAHTFDWSVVTQDILMVYETAIEAWAPPHISSRWRRGGTR
ncbi:glycosyltransferase family 4 protein [Luteipulveratus mongoliensis]|uniref:D-inositol 3-phosphate glycosyltransferase n=1 Tax=Luteipulveratus mongoliensis TaxID=571913 RepID=A0A0K1JQF9_9MICO|nr:glycosyltransferase family 4 protein [Luteipulveratus mongoliensis]AKU18959.1 GDP-mannose-dependent alpha-(1-2)-phosphatidylinositol mannosyltransferase [Luteipulveratus mongoliensis]